MIVAGVCLANGLGSLCGPTSSSGFGGGFDSGLGSAGSSVYSGSSPGSSSGSSSSREHSISSMDSILSDMVNALSGDLLEADLDTQCHGCDVGVPSARCTQCNEALCERCASVHEVMTKDHVLIRLLDALPYNLSVPPPHLPAPLPVPLAAQQQLPPPPPPAGIAAQARRGSPPVSAASPRSPQTCELHPAELLRLYCEQCAVAVCGLCAARDGHRGHTMTHIKAAVASTQKYMKDSMAGAHYMRERLDEAAKMAAAVDTKALKVAAEVRRASRALVAAVEARERELLQQVEKVRDAKARSLLIQTEMLRGLHRRFVRLGESLRDTMARGDGVDFVHARDKAAVELTQLAGARAGATPLPFEDDAMAFVPPEPILLTALSSAGSVTSSAYALSTVATGEGLTRATRSRSAAFTVRVRNHLDDASVPGGEVVEAVLVAADGTVTHVDVKDNGDGNFLATYRPLDDGPHALHVTLRGRHIVGSPFAVTVRGLRAYEAVRVPAVSFGGEGSEDGRFLRPWGVCCDRNGRVIVADRSNNRVQVFRPDGRFLHKFGSQGTGPGQFDRPAGVAADGQNRIIVADKDNHRVQIFTPEGDFVLAFGECGAKNGQFNYPWDVDVNAAGQIVVSDTRNHRIQLFSSEGVFLRKYGWETSAGMWRHFDTPRGVAFTPQGYVIVTDFNNHRLVVVEPTFRNARFLGSEGAGMKQFQRPQGVAVDGDGNIIVADSRNNRVQVFKSDGTFMCQLGLPGLEMDRPSGLCITPEGHVAVVDFGHNRVLML